MTQLHLPMEGGVRAVRFGGLRKPDLEARGLCGGTYTFDFEDLAETAQHASQLDIGYGVRQTAKIYKRRFESSGDLFQVKARPKPETDVCMQFCRKGL